MFVIRRIYDDLLSVNQRALAAVQQMLREQFQGIADEKIQRLPQRLTDHPSPKFRMVLLVAETARGVKGFAILLYATDLRFCFLEFIAAARFETQPLAMMLGGERRTMDPQGAPRFHALYELESPEVLLSPAWAKAVEEGRWPAQVRPHTSNRRHLLLKRLVS
mgnify:CR=1 FL=1